MSSTMTEKLAGCYRGIVLDSNDPQGLHRVRVQVPDLLGLSDLGWAWPAIPNLAGQTPPNEQDPVWVIFEAGDIERPVYIGTWIPTRPGGGPLQDNYVLSGGSNVYPSAASEFFGVQVNGDTFDRYTATAGGTQYWGPGNAPADVSLGCLSPSTLGLTGNLSITGALSAASLSVSGSISGAAISASSVAVTGAISAASLLLTTPLPVSSGGTGSAVQNFVDLTTTQNIAGIKTFTSAPVVPTNSFPETAVTNLVTDLAARALDSTVMHLAGTETVTGPKTFSTAPLFSTPLGIASGGTGSATQNFVDLTTAQSIGGLKTFTGGLASTATDARFGQGAAGAVGANVLLTGDATTAYVRADGSLINIALQLRQKGTGHFNFATSTGGTIFDVSDLGELNAYNAGAQKFRVDNTGAIQAVGDSHYLGRSTFGAAGMRLRITATDQVYLMVENETGLSYMSDLWLQASSLHYIVNTGGTHFFGNSAGATYLSIDSSGGLHQNNGTSGIYATFAEGNGPYTIRIGEIFGDGGLYKATGNMHFEIGDIAGSFKWTYQNNPLLTLARNGTLTLSAGQPVLVGGPLVGGVRVGQGGTLGTNTPTYSGSWSWTTTTYANMNAGFAPTFTRTGSPNASLLVRLQASGYMSGAPGWVELGVNVNGTDYTICHFFFNELSSHRSFSGERQLPLAGTGATNITPRIRVQGGCTFQVDTNDVYFMTITEC